MVKHEILRVLNVLYPITKVVERRGSNVKCPNPQHLDDKPSSHIYEGNRVWCFTCKQFYYVANIVEYNKLNYNEMFEEILKNYKDEEELLKDFEEKRYKKDEVKEEEIKIKKDESVIDFAKRYFNGNTGV